MHEKYMPQAQITQLFFVESGLLSVNSKQQAQLMYKALTS